MWWLVAGVVLAVSARELAVGLVQAARDLSGHDFSDTAVLAERWRAGEVPLWLPNARLGQPFLALLYTQALYPPRILTALWFGPVLGPNVMHVFHAALAFAGAMLAARRLGLRRAEAFIAAAPFPLSPFFSEFAQNLSFASTAAWAPWILWAALGVRRSPSVRSAAWLGLWLGVAFHAGAPEMWLWECLLVALVLGLKRSTATWGALGVAWGGALAAVVALPALELSREYTLPGRVFGQLEWSVSGLQFLSMAVPDADLPRVGGYWGGDDQHFFFTLLLGSLPVCLALVGCSVRRARPLLALGVVCAVLALGHHFGLSRWLLSLPPFSLFRYPAKYAVGLLFSLSLLAGVGARRARALSRRARLAPVRALWVGLGAGLWLAAQLEGAREGLAAHAGWWVAATVLAAVTAGRSHWLAAAVAVELLAVPHERWPRLPREALEQPSPLGARLRAEAQRVSVRVDLDDSDPLACGPWELEGAGDALLLAGRARLSGLRFVEEGLRATGGYGFRDPWRLSRAFAAGRNAFALANVTHFVRNTDAPAPLPGLTPRLEPGLAEVWTWTWSEARPRSWVATRALILSDDEAFQRLAGPLELPEVWLNEGTPLTGDCLSPPAETEDESPEVVRQHVHACAEGYAVLADAWYPGWQVSVDGALATPLRAFGFLRSVHVPAGDHLIEWRYRPASVRFGGTVSALALLVSLIVLGGNPGNRRRLK